MRLKGWGSPNSNEGTYTVVLYIYKYFVVSTLAGDRGILIRKICLHILIDVVQIQGCGKPMLKFVKILLLSCLIEFLPLN